MTGDKGALLIIKNYSGDVMNFKNAAYLAQDDGILVDYVKVDDDIAVKDSLYTVGRRGVAGTLFVHKLAGAAAEQGKKLTEVKRIAEKAAMNVRSLGFALTSCTVPAKGTPTFELAEDEMEYGVGIHGEPGIRREKVINANEIAGRVVGSICNELGIQTGRGDRVALLINGFGGTPLMELYLLNNEVSNELSKRNVKIARTFVGNYMTSIDMAGASVSILKLDAELEGLLNMPCETPAMKISGEVEEPTVCNEIWIPEMAAGEESEVWFGVETLAEYAHIRNREITLSNMVYIVDTMSATIIGNEVPFCELDAHAGDGDFGMSVAKGFKQLKREWKDILNQPGLSIGTFLDACSMVIMEHCGGASGPIWGSAFRAAGKSAMGKATLNLQDFSDMIQAAVKGVQITGERAFGRGAAVGDKTLIDALSPCADAWSLAAQQKDSFLDAFRLGAKAAQAGAESTKKIVARMGRAGAVGERSLGYPDAGAYALGVVFSEIAKGLAE